MDAEQAGMLFGLGFLTLVTAIVIVVIWQIFATAQARASAGREDAYRALAEEATQLQRTTAEHLDRALGELTALREQTADLNRLLRQVE